MKKITLTVSFIAACFCYSVGQNRINVIAGQKLHSVNNTIGTISQSVMGQEIEIKSNVTTSLEVEITEASPAIRMSTKIARLQVKSEAMGNNTDFDSDKKEDRDGQAGQLLSSVLGKSFDLSINTDGKLIKNTTKADPATEAAKSMLGNFDELSYELVMPIPPSLKSGDTWTEESNENADNVKKIEYKVLSINATVAILSFKGTLTAKANKSVQGMDATVTSNSNLTGEVSVDAKSGIIKKKKTETESKGTTEIMGQSIPFTIKQVLISSNE